MLITAIFAYPVRTETLLQLIRSEEGIGKGVVVPRYTVFISSEKTADYWLSRLIAATGQTRICVTASTDIATNIADEAFKDWLSKAIK